MHGTHDIVVIYYAKFPNDYLKAAAKHGIHWRAHAETKEIQLRHTKRMHMRITEERIECFKLLARLLYYLKSGKSYVGYTRNFEGNPLHSRVCPREFTGADECRLMSHNRQSTTRSRSMRMLI